MLSSRHFHSLSTKEEARWLKGDLPTLPLIVRETVRQASSVSGLFFIIDDNVRLQGHQ